MKRWICLSLVLICLVCYMQPMQAFAAENRTGWVEEEGNTYYIDPQTGEKVFGTVIIDGKMCKFSDYGVYLGRETAGWIWVNGNTYYIMDNEGTVATSWKKLGGYWYFFNSSGHMHTGWLQLGSIWYYLDESGSMVTGEYAIGGKIHVFDSNGVWQSEKAKKTGWVKENGCWYYYMLDGSMATGLMLIDGKLYAFDGEGKMFADTLVNETGGNSYYAGADGALLTGWHCLKNGWYYFYKDGHMAKNTYIDNYYLNEKGMNTLTVERTTLLNFSYGASKEDAAKAETVMREIAQDAMKNGGETDYEQVKYALQKLRKLCPTRYTSNIPLGVEFSIAGPLLYGIAGNGSDVMAMSRILSYMGYENMLDGDLVYLKMDGEYGWANVWTRDIGFGNPSDDGKYTPLNIIDPPNTPSGAWVQVQGKWYFRTPQGKNYTGWLYNGNKWYYLKSDGVMATGWALSGSKWYYLNADGSMKTGWLLSGGKWYFLREDGDMATGKFYTMGAHYYANQNGVMQTGWLYQGGKWYYMDQSGAMVIGVQAIGGKVYCFMENGQMQVGWFRDYYANWYYADGNGVLAKGWKMVSGTYYYFYNDYHMAAKTFIDNYYVDESGAWVSTASVNRDPQHYKGLTADQAAQADAVAKAIADEAMANGGETDGAKIYYAAQLVGQYVRNCSYGNDSDKYYRSPYGVFVAQKYTCAGATRAMGRVLEFMGYKWYHPGENQWDHQWVCVKMDGEYGWIDVQWSRVYMGFGNLLDNYIAY